MVTPMELPTRRLARSLAWKIPPVARLLRQRDALAIENRRLFREINQLKASAAPSAEISSFDALKYPARLNLGCGFDHKEGYLNVDLNSFHKPDLVADVRVLPMLPSGHYDEILAIDILEHLHRDDTEVALKEWGRLLKLGGVLNLQVPSLLDIAKLIQKAAHQIDEQKRILQDLFGTQAYTGDFHYTSFTLPLLTDYLRTAGFKVHDWSVRQGWLLEVSAVKISTS